MRLSLLLCVVTGCLTFATHGTLGRLSLVGNASGSGASGSEGGSGSGSGGKAHWTAGEGSPTSTGNTEVEYSDGKATIPWREIEGISPDGNRSYLYSACAQLNQFWGSEISCRVDHPSFQRFYDSLAKQKARVRDLGGNSGNVGSMFSVAIGCFSDYATALGSIVYSFGARNDKTKAEFKTKVKTITIRYIDGTDPAEKSKTVEPFVELKGTDLVLHVRADLVSGSDGMWRSDSSGIMHGCGWINAGVLANFPQLKKVYDDFH